MRWSILKFQSIVEASYEVQMLWCDTSPLGILKPLTRLGVTSFFAVSASIMPIQCFLQLLIKDALDCTQALAVKP